MKSQRHADLIAQACDLITDNNKNSASALIAKNWPFVSTAKAERRRTRRQLMGIWKRDGFLCRYSGEQLVFPGVLRLLGILLPEEFPYHRNWKLDSCHIAFWELYPTHDHVQPVARGGSDEESENIVTTSMRRNQIKAQWTLGEIGWELLPSGDFREWDGLTGWFVDYIDSCPEIARANRAIGEWYSVGRAAVR